MRRWPDYSGWFEVTLRYTDGTSAVDPTKFKTAALAEGSAKLYRKRPKVTAATVGPVATPLGRAA